MSIEDEIIAHIKSKRIYLYVHYLGTPARDLMLSEEVNRLIYGPQQDGDPKPLRCAKLAGHLRRFVSGGLITIAPHPNHEQTAIMAKLPDGVWEYRSEDKPEISLFGMFASTDNFVLLTWIKRNRIGSREWRDAIEQCKVEWRNIFTSYPPQSSEVIHDCISQNFRVFPPP